MQTVYVFGHQNPDTDTVCSAIAYAHLKNMGEGHYLPARLGDLNRETEFVLETFGVPLPEYLPHMYVRVQDVMTRDPVVGHANDTIHEVGTLMRRHAFQAIPIVDEDRHAIGVVTERHLARSYLKELEVQNLSGAPTPLDQIAETLSARILVGSPAQTVQGNVLVGAMSPPSMKGYIKDGDLVIVGNRENAQLAALDEGISCLIITGGFNPTVRVQKKAAAQGAALLVTPNDTFAAARLINLSVSVLTLMEREVLTVSPGTLVREITQDLLESRLGIVLVTDRADRLVGVVTKSDIVKQQRRPAILVDHSEESQSVEGIEQANILEILDHHRLGGLETAGPILAMIAPVGCTATLVLRRYREMGVTPPWAIAGLLLAAILSDTMLLKSPTTTQEDRNAVDYLSTLVDEDPVAFGVRMYDAKFDMARLRADEILTADMKEFALERGSVAVAQLEVGDKERVLVRKGELLQAMEELRQRNGYVLMLLMITDIQREGTELLVAGHTRVAERAFNCTLTDQAVFLPGVMSRKKQVIPPLSGLL